ncbi:MAG: hypothetical protein EAZ43_12185 [Betaproteobacteria bacterium]|nr:MAG: hypothetical protein EAZ43_12185 [Betaproteobacteria bacterium]
MKNSSFRIICAALPAALLLAAGLSHAQSAPPKVGATLAKPITGVATTASVPVAPVLPKLAVVMVELRGPADAATGVEVCVKNTGLGAAKGVRIGAGFKHKQGASGATTYHHLGAYAGEDIAPGATLCKLNNFGDWQREWFRKCWMFDIQGGIGDSSQIDPQKSITIQPACRQRISADPFPRPIASAPLLRPTLDTPVVIPPKLGPVPPPPIK